MLRKFQKNSVSNFSDIVITFWRNFSQMFGKHRQNFGKNELKRNYEKYTWKFSWISNKFMSSLKKF